MKSTNPLNIFTGPDGIRKYYDPDDQPLLPLVELPERLNPFYNDNVRIYAKMMTMLPAHNVKALPGMYPAGKAVGRSSNPTMKGNSVEYALVKHYSREDKDYCGI